jgi:hypothetical protein
VSTAANDNPYVLYQQLIGLVGPDGTPTPGSEEAMALLAESRNSVHDLVRDELHGLMGNSRLSSDDKQRLQQHFDSIRDLEVNMGGMGGELVERCSWDGVEIGQLEALETFAYDRHGRIEIDIVRMQTLAAGLDHFKARGLEDKAFVLWTNGFTDCPAHSFRSVPHIVWVTAAAISDKAPTSTPAASPTTNCSMPSSPPPSKTRVRSWKPSAKAPPDSSASRSLERRRGFCGGEQALSCHQTIWPARRECPYRSTSMLHVRQAIARGD